MNKFINLKNQDLFFVGQDGHYQNISASCCPPSQIPTLPGLCLPGTVPGRLSCLPVDVSSMPLLPLPAQPSTSISARPFSPIKLAKSHKEEKGLKTPGMHDADATPLTCNNSGHR